MGSHERVHFMDNLRAFAMLLGIFFHAALAYSPMLKDLWLSADPQNSEWVDVLAFFSHSFRMPLFFIIAGFFTAMLVQKRSISGAIKNRLLRILTSFGIFLPLTWTVMAIMIGWSLESVENKSPMLGMIAFMSQNPDAPPPPVTTVHLWFLYYLLLFYILAFGVSKFISFDWLARVKQHPLLLVLLYPLLLSPFLASQYAPFPAPEQFTPAIWASGFYGFLFSLGWALYKHIDLLDKLRPYIWFMLLMSVVCYAVFYQLLPKTTSLQEIMQKVGTTPALDAKQLLLGVLQAYLAVLMSLSLLVIGKFTLNKQNQLVRFIADSSYWLYIVHLPILWWIQFILLDTHYSLLTEFCISIGATLAIGWISYLVFVRWTPIGWMLNGRKKPTS